MYGSGSPQCKILMAGICPQWLAVVGIDHHSDKIAITTNSLTNIKNNINWIKILSLNCQLLYIYMCVCSVYKECPRHCLSTETKDHRFWRTKTHFILTTNLQNLGTSLWWLSLQGPLGQALLLQAIIPYKYIYVNISQTSQMSIVYEIHLREMPQTTNDVMRNQKPH